MNLTASKEKTIEKKKEAEEIMNYFSFLLINNEIIATIMSDDANIGSPIPVLDTDCEVVGDGDGAVISK